MTGWISSRLPLTSTEFVAGERPRRFHRYRARRYAGQQTGQSAYTKRVGAVQDVSTLRAPEPVRLFRMCGKEAIGCPHCGGTGLYRDFDGVGCVNCGWHCVEVGRPLPLEA